MGTIAVRRLPLAPLERLVRVDDPTSESIAACFGLTAVAWRMMRKRGLSLWQADRLAIAAGFHPMNVWPEWVDAAFDTPQCSALSLDDEEVAA